MAPQEPKPGSVIAEVPPPFIPGMRFVISCTYDQDARKGGRTPQYPYHPQLQAFYAQEGRTLGYWFCDPEKVCLDLRNNHDGTFTAAGIEVPFQHMIELPGWDKSKPGNLGLGVYNVAEIKDIQTWWTFAYADFRIEAVPQ